MHVEDITLGEHYVLFANGSSIGNPGPAGWASVLYRQNGAEVTAGPIEVKGGEPKATINRMEIVAAISGLSRLAKNDLPAIIYTDSQNIVLAMTEWLPMWKARGWRTAGKKPVKNQELWKALEKAVGGRVVDWRLCKDYPNGEGKERANSLARDEAGRMFATVEGL